MSPDNYLLMYIPKHMRFQLCYRIFACKCTYLFLNGDVLFIITKDNNSTYSTSIWNPYRNHSDEHCSHLN